MTEIWPGLPLILGAVVVAALRGPVQRALALALPVLGLAALFLLPEGDLATLRLFDYDLVPVRVDPLSRVFGIIFHIAAFLGTLYSWHVKDSLQHVAGLVYAGAAVAAVFAADLISLFVFWELTAISSVFLIWASRSERAYRAGMRYLIVQVGSGVLLLAGAILIYRATGSLRFEAFGLEGPGQTLIFFAFGIKAAFPLLHNWLQDAYIGAIMTAFPIFYAVIENDLRRVLAYSLNNQLGFMVVGIGVGTELAINGTVAHAFSHIIYKALLFMSMGAVLYRVGTVKGTDLGGLYKSMPWSTGFCIVGAASISAFPLFSGFISKSLILTATAHEGYWGVWAVLLFASAGVFHHSGIKIPFFAFFAHDSGKRCAEAPPNMLAAMGLAAFLCVFLGVYPEPLYRLLPFAVDFVPYTRTHVITQLQLLLFSALAFAFLMRTGLYPPETRSVNLDFDWVYRKALPAVVAWILSIAGPARTSALSRAERRLERFLLEIYRHHGPNGILARTVSTGSTVLWIAVLLGLTLLLYYL
jgi:multicomponent Na+:H+ antiporter subunit D